VAISRSASRLTSHSIFVEGTGLYRFELNCYIVVDCSTNEGLFYSRRIGRSPQLRSEYGDETTPTATTIAAATKLTGRTRRGLAFGVLDAVTGGDADIGLIGTAVNRADDQYTRPFLHQSAYSAGATFRNRFSGRRYELAGQIAASRVAGTREAILRTQQGSVHYYQQPGDDIAVDSTRESLAGYSAQLKLKVQWRHHALRDERHPHVAGLRGERPGLPPPCRRHGLEHVGRAVVS
jgi:hypothetical protein